MLQNDEVQAEAVRQSDVALDQEQLAQDQLQAESLADDRLNAEVAANQQRESLFDANNQFRSNDEFFNRGFNQNGQFGQLNGINGGLFGK